MMERQIEGGWNKGVTRRGFLALAGALSLAGCSAAPKPQPKQDEAPAKEADVPDSPYAKGVHHAEIVVRDFGKIELALNGDMAPITVANFADLVNRKFYDGLTFHRVIRDFMIQGGDPKGDGTGGSDQTIKGEFASNGVKNYIAHVRGTISMARSSDPNSASSQFFIVQKEYPSLDGKYAAFGSVTDGMDVVDKIVDATASKGDANGMLPRDAQPVIESIRMID